MAQIGYGNNWRTLINDEDNGKQYDLIEEIRDLKKIKKQFFALHNLLIQKEILTETEMEEFLDSVEVMDNLSEDK